MDAEERDTPDKTPESKPSNVTPAGAKRIRMRLDFKIEVVKYDEKSGIMWFALVPDPRRYDWREIDGKRYLFDKLDGVLIPEEVFQDQRKLVGKPIYHQPALIDDAVAYVENRRATIKSMLEGVAEQPIYSDPSEEFLRGLEADALEFVILSVDLVDSTTFATEAPEEYLRTNCTLLFELSAAIPLFRGHVLKYTGDGLIAYFPSPSFLTKNDLAIDCALTLHRLVYDGMNPVLAAMNRRQVDIRIGIDSGEAAVVVMGSAVTKQHKDIIGDVVSLACKIQSRAPVGAIALGDVTLRNLHTMWRARCRPLAMPPEWQYKDRETGMVYGVSIVAVQPSGPAETRSVIAS